MKKMLSLHLFFLFSAFTTYGVIYNVTVPDGTKACYIAGEMNNWSQQVMNKVDATHYTLDIASATTAHKYKYCSGPGWAYVENIADNRSYSANDVVNSWAQIYDPAVQPTDITFSVTVPSGTNACFFAGAATNWGHVQMQKADATHFKITLNTTTPNDYKYCSGPDWAYEEVDASGNTISNRQYNANDVVVKWKAVYVPPMVYNVTVPTGTKACYIAGEMNNWLQQAMTNVDETHYTLTIANATAAMKYKYCSGPDWSYEELNADNSKVADRTYSNADVVAKWAGIWDPSITVTQINNSLTLGSGTVTRYSFNSSYIGARTVDVWLPENYTVNKKYAVLYMHDGQMLFDATQTWNGQEWKVDETISQLLQNSEIKDIIVVGVWNSNDRYSEYYPKKSMDHLPENIRSLVMSNVSNDPKADKYLNFLVTELKPYIDKTYSVNTDLANTYIAGSSMGGLISWYAMCEFPDIFGGAICMSTHWANNNMDSPEIPNSFRKYLLAQLPSPANHKIYFDHGTVDLDANYAVHQVLTDTIMKFKGYTSNNWESLVFTSDGHNETAWANRFNVPLKFILKANSSTPALSLTTNFAQQSYECGSHVAINWTSSSVENVKIEFSGDNGTTWQTITSSVSASAGVYDWITPTTALYECKIKISDVVNASLYSTSSGIFVVYNHLPDKVEPLLRIYYPVFTYPYNTLYPNTTTSDSEIINGKVGNACGPTAVSNILAYWEFPRRGFGSRTFTDNRNCTWSADFSASNYNYDLLTDKLTTNSPQSVIDANATLVYHAGVAMHNIWRSGNSFDVLNGFKQYLGFNANAKELNRDDYTPQQWEKVMKSELSLGRPQIVQGWAKINPDGSHDGHWFMCDGYSADNQFHVSLDYGAGSQKYYPLYEFDVYKLKNWIFAYLEPEKNGKKLELTSPTGNENWQQGSMQNIKWTSNGVTNVKIEFSSDGGVNWSTLVNSVPASTGNYNVTLPIVVSAQCKIRITDADNINIYSRNRMNFSTYDSKSLILAAPPAIISNITAGTTLPIRWTSKGVNNIKIEYSSDNGQNWHFITEIETSQHVYKWVSPNDISLNFKVRISDATDNSVFAENQAFRIVKPNNVGGPYLFDTNTIALFHFDNDIDNYSTLSGNSTTGSFDNVQSDNNLPTDLANCYQTTNSLTIPHSANLNLTGDWTIEGWIKLNSYNSNDYMYLIKKPGDTDAYQCNYALGISPWWGNKIYGFYFSEYNSRMGILGNIIELNKWYHIAFIRDTKNINIELVVRNSDRKEIFNQSMPYTSTTTYLNTQNLIIGGGLDGYIDEVRISNVVRDFTFTGINNIKAEPLFSVYPNPTEGIVHLNLKKEIIQGVVKILNFNGQIILEKEIRTLNNKEINLTNLVKGMYFIQLSGNGYIWTEKLVLR